MRHELAGRLLAALLALALVAPAPVLSQIPPGAAVPSQAPAAAPAGLEAGAWPRQFQAGDMTVEVYEPQIDSWQGNRLEARTALSVTAAGAPAPSYGVIWITARTEVDKAQGLVTLEDIKVTRASFPGLPQKQ